MALYHLHVKNISRGDDRSAVAAAAYRAGETLPNEAEERLSMFGGRRDVLHAEIRAPAHAPAWCLERGALWNAVEAVEKRKDARLAKEIEFSIPRELPKASWLGVAQAMADAYAALGHVVDFAIHDDGSGLNPHVHMMLTTRVLEGGQFGGKMREADNLAFVNNARALWEKIANDALGEAGLEVEIDARSHAARGLGTTPTQHRGPNPEERQARRAAARARGAPMNAETLAARRAVLADKEALERFPLLRERPDWPPAHLNPSPSLTAAELREHEAFWQEVKSRQVEPEQAPDAVTPAPPPETDRAQQPVTPLEVPRVAIRQEGALRPFDASREAADVFAALDLALSKASVAAGHSQRDPRSAAEWREVLRASNELKTKFAELRAENERHRAYAEAFREKYLKEERDPDDFPVQGPDDDLIAPSERERAQEEMIAEVEQPARELPQTPRPERQPAAERQAVAEEVTRANHTPELAWLRQELAKVPSRESELEQEREHNSMAPPQGREPQTQQIAPELAWLRQELAKTPERKREQEQERERER